MTAIVDVSFACHMPDCLEMPYKPTITEALPDVAADKPTYRIGGNSCLSGDFVGDWSFEQPLKPGDILTFEDMNHYTTVKTNMFNGIQHPALYLQRNDGTIQCLRRYTYEDYKNNFDYTIEEENFNQVLRIIKELEKEENITSQVFYKDRSVYERYDTAFAEILKKFAIKKFKNEMIMGRHGKFGKFTNPQYVKKSQKSLI